MKNSLLLMLIVLAVLPLGVGVAQSIDQYHADKKVLADSASQKLRTFSDSSGLVKESLKLKEKLDSGVTSLNTEIQNISENVARVRTAPALSPLDSLKKLLPLDSSKKIVTGLTEKLSNTNVNINPLNLSDEEKSFLKQSGLPSIDFPRANGLPNEIGQGIKFDNPKVNLPLPEVRAIELKTALSDSKIIKQSVPDLKLFRKTPTEITSISTQVEKIKVPENPETIIRDAEKTDKAIEEGLSKIANVSEARDELAAAERLKKLQDAELQKISDFDKMREQKGVQGALKKMIANEDILRGQIKKLSKLKKRFDVIEDFRRIPKIRPNSLKGKSFGERLAPGITFQVLKDEAFVNWFFSPEVVYKFSGTFSAGVGGMYRLRYSLKPDLDWNNPIYGYRFISQVKLYKGFYGRFELERNSIFAPAGNLNLADQHRVWKMNGLVGLGRHQNISHRFDAFFWAFYNTRKDPTDIFTGRVVVKSGLQIKLYSNTRAHRKYLDKKLTNERGGI